MKRNTLDRTDDFYAKCLNWFEPRYDKTNSQHGFSELVTVVLPVFNAETTVKTAIDSVLNQEQCRIELIVIDDGSTDSTPGILSRFGDSIRVIRQDRQSVNGLGSTRNRAAFAGTGKWIAFIDADDVWHPHKIRLQLSAVAVTGAAVVFSNASSVGSDRVRQCAYSADDRPEGDTFSLLIQDNFIFTSSVLLSRQVFVAVGGFTTRSDVVQDWDLWLRLAAAGVKFVGLSEALIDYRWTENSVSKSHDSMRRRRLGALRHAIEVAGYGRLSVVARQIARSNLETVSAWFLAQDNTSRAVWWYLRALAYWPFNAKAIKGLVKSSIGLR